MWMPSSTMRNDSGTAAPSRAIVLFDVADTLLYKPDLFPTIYACLTRAGINRNETEIRAVHTRLRERTQFPDATNREFYQAFNIAFLDALDVPAWPELALDIYVSCKTLGWRAFEDVAVLTTLPAQLGIVSNWDRSLRQLLKDSIGLAFDPVIVSGEVGVAKPQPAIFRMALERIPGGPEAVLYVGDLPRLDMAPAAQVGLQPVLIDRFGLHDEYAGLRIRSLADLTTLVSQWAPRQ